ncbi:CreA family protein [Symbiopectobacterium sp. Eva_TO]
MKNALIMGACFALLGVVCVAKAEQIGSVDTVFKLLGPDHKIVVEAFDDPDVANVTCYLSRAKTGGIKGGLGHIVIHIFWPFFEQDAQNPVN